MYWKSDKYGSKNSDNSKDNKDDEHNMNLDDDEIKENTNCIENNNNSPIKAANIAKTGTTTDKPTSDNDTDGDDVAKWFRNFLHPKNRFYRVDRIHVQYNP